MIVGEIAVHDISFRCCVQHKHVVNMSLISVLLRVVFFVCVHPRFAHAIPISTLFHSTSGYMESMRPSLPIWWDAPAMTDVEPDEESAAGALKRMSAERAIVEPVLVHIRDLWDDVDSAEPHR